MAKLEWLSLRNANYTRGVIAPLRWQLHGPLIAIYIEMVFIFNAMQSREHHTAGFNNLRAHTVLRSNLPVSSQNIAKNILKM